MVSAPGHAYSWLKKLYLSPKYSDVTIRVEESDVKINMEEEGSVSLPAHSLVLRSQSAVFDAMLSTDAFAEGQTGVVTVVGFSRKAVEHFLRYLYLDCLEQEVPEVNLLELLKMSHQYQTAGLLWECTRRLCNSVRVDNACQLYQTSANLGVQYLRQASEAAIKSNLHLVLENDLLFEADRDLVYPFIPVPATTSIVFRKAFRRIANYQACTGQKWADDKLPVVNADQEGSPYRKSVGSNCFPADLYLDGRDSDLEVVVGGEPHRARFPAHSQVLISQSKVFREKWTSLEQKRNGSPPAEIQLCDCSPRVVEYLLRYMYMQHLPSVVGEANLRSLLDLAREHEVKGLVDLCQKRLLEKRRK